MITNLVAVVRGNEVDLELAVADLLEIILSDNQDDFDDATVVDMVSLTNLRTCLEPEDGSGPMRLAGFVIDLPEEVQYPERVLDELTTALFENAPFTHAVRFEDETLRSELARLASQIFALEMKLRRALTFVYLFAYPEGDPYQCLVEEKVQPVAKERPKAEQMKAAGENLFFHLNFSQYVGLNSRPKPKPDDLMHLIANSDHFEALQFELSRQPIQQEEDAVFLAGLKSQMEAIEAMRNCVAHNRRPNRKISENYQQAYGSLNNYIDDYLNGLEIN